MTRTRPGSDEHFSRGSKGPEFAPASISATSGSVSRSSPKWNVPSSLADRWSEFGEGLVTFSSVKGGRSRLVVLTLHPCEAPLKLRVQVSLDCKDWMNWDDEVARLRRFLDAPTPVIEVPLCPYPGMVPFLKEDARFFHGRDDEIQKLLTLVRHHHFLAIVGSSGSGKSSLVTAGLLPKLDEPRNFPPGTWRVLTMRPGATPSDELAATLGGDSKEASSTITRMLSAEPRAQKLLLVVDQFEELFSQVRDATKRDEFIGRLKGLRADPRCTIILTMRADFYGDLMNCPLWPIDKSQLLPVAALGGEALRQAIVKPAEAVGVYLEEGLVDRLLADAAGEPGFLPMLQEALVLLWGTMSGRLLTRASYERFGHDGRSGLAVAMATKADATLANLPEDRRKISRRIFLRLVQFGEGRPDTRRQLAEGDLRASGDDPAVFEHVLTTLVDNRLLTPSPDDSRGRRFDIAHEMLIVGWPASEQWVQARRDAEKTRRRLVAKAEEWVHLRRGESGLLDAGELIEADRWLTSPDAEELGVDRDVRDLAESSRAALDRQAARERRRTHVTIISLTAGLVVCAVFLAFAMIEARRANRAADLAERSLHIENCTHLIGKPQSVTDWSPDLLKQVDGEITWIAKRSPNDVDRLRKDRDDALERTIGDALRAETLDGKYQAEVERLIASLEGYEGATEAANLRGRLDERLRRWDKLFDLAGPKFEDLGSRFDLADVRVANDLVENQRPPAKGSEPIVKARGSFSGGLRLRARFDRNWESCSDVGLVLDTARGEGYRFLLASRASSAATAEVGPPTFEAIRRQHVPMSVKITRGRVKLRETFVTVPEGGLQLEATRIGDDLALSLNQKVILTFNDPFPIGDDQPVELGLVLPKGVGLGELLVERQRQPRTQIAMDRGDASYAAGNYADALREYEKQALASVGKAAEAEASYKQALCLKELKRKDDAIPILDRLTDRLAGASDAASRWPLRAACQLWLLYLQRNDRDHAEQLLNKLAPSYSFQELAALVPVEEREMILAAYSVNWGGEWNAIVYKTDDKDVERVRKAVNLLDVLGEEPDQRQSMTLRLIDTLRVVGRVEEARQVAFEQLNQGNLIPRYRVQLLSDIAWMRIETGKVGDALDALDTLDRALASGGDALPTALLLVDRARVKCILEKPAEAETDLDTFFKRAPLEQLEYAEYAEARILQGLIRDRRGDHDGALQAWRQGLLADWSERLPRITPGRPMLLGLGARLRGESVAFHAVLMSLVGEITEAEVVRQYNVTIASSTIATREKNEIFTMAGNRLIPADLMRRAIARTYATPQARDFLWKMATHQVSLPVFLQEPFELIIQAVIVVSAVDRDFSFEPGELGAETEATIRKAVRLLFAHYNRSKITNRDIAQLAPAWLGLGDLASIWKSLSTRLDAELAPLLAYGFGRRCLAPDREQNPIHLFRRDGSAAVLFRAAVAGVPAGSLISRLAQAELEHLPKWALGR